MWSLPAKNLHPNWKGKINKYIYVKSKKAKQGRRGQKNNTKGKSFNTPENKEITMELPVQERLCENKGHLPWVSKNWVEWRVRFEQSQEKGIQSRDRLSEQRYGVEIKVF